MPQMVKSQKHKKWRYVFFSGQQRYIQYQIYIEKDMYTQLQLKMLYAIFDTIINLHHLILL